MIVVFLQFSAHSECCFAVWLKTLSALRRRLSVMAVKCQASSLLGRLETLGPGGTAALRRRQQAAELERTWQRESRAQMQAARDGFRGLRSGFAKLD